MSIWDDEFQNHGIHSNLDSTRDGLALALAREDLAPDVIESLARISNVLARFDTALDSAEPQLVPKQLLDASIGPLENLKAQVSAFTADANAAHLKEANEHANQLLIQLGRMVLAIAPSDIEGVRDAVVSFRMSAGQHLRHLADLATEIQSLYRTSQSNLEELKSEISSQKARLDSAISAFQQQFSEAESARSSQYGEAESRRSNQFAEAVATRGDKFTEFMGLSRSEVEALTQTLEQAAESLMDETRLKFDEFYESLQRHKGRAEELVHVIAQTGMIGGYQKEANTARRGAIFWQFLSVISILGVVVASFYMFVLQLGTLSGIEEFLGRAFVTGSIGVLATYSARQAGKNQEVERYNRRMELELASIDPYIVPLPLENQHKIKELIVDRLFGQKMDFRFHEAESGPGTGTDLVLTLVELLREAIKKSK